MSDTTVIAETPAWLWAGFVGLTLALLVADMLTSRRLHHASIRLAALHVAGWVSIAAGVCLMVWDLLGPGAAAEFAIAYALELSLSVDNVFVFAVTFAVFAVDERAQRRALLWGVLGAVLMRAGCILGGVALLEAYQWTMYLFGGVLALTAVRMIAAPASEPNVASHWAVRFFRKILPLTDHYDGDRFLTRTPAGWRATPLLLVVCVVELTDLLFAIDSIPAVLGVTRDPFIAFSSNVMAVLGLRALYFLVAGFLKSAQSLKYGLALVLFLIGCKFVAEPLGWHVPPAIVLSTIALVLGANLGLVFLLRRRGPAPG
ncbi:MAG: TerC/Alx family metal homeostasis membrane protein [Planctomycetota bacterium]|nr:TerC/Alx family metal homeostasis membrane protein [Planctomycetota bacterium]MDA1106237.1 TerC/Alx family metal homeostasis membrane protein [Planctomycetota bacterium]